MDTNNELVLVDRRENGIVILTLNSPPLNLLGFDLMQALRQNFLKLSRDKDVRVIIVTATGEKAFCAGADAKHFTDFAPGVNTPWGQAIMSVIASCPVPTIVAYHGYCLGGAIELGLACDIRIATENAVFRLPEANLGLVPAWGGTTKLPLLIGEGNAKLLMFTCDDFSGKEAYEMGLVQKCVPAEKLMDTCMELAQRIATRAPKSLAAIKNIIRTSQQSIIGAGLLSEQENNTICANSEDKKEGIRALKEKRKPVFKNQ